MARNPHDTSIIVCVMRCPRRRRTQGDGSVDRPAREPGLREDRNERPNRPRAECGVPACRPPGAGGWAYTAGTPCAHELTLETRCLRRPCQPMDLTSRRPPATATLLADGPAQGHAPRRRRVGLGRRRGHCPSVKATSAPTPADDVQ